MAPKLFSVFIIQALILKAYSSQIQPGVKQYIVTVPQLSVPTVQTPQPNSPKPAASLSSLSSLASLLSSGVPSSATTAPTPLTSTSLASLLSAVQQPKKVAHVIPIPEEKPATSNGVDMELLNNLAIALQLMIVNNILASPLPEVPNSKPPEAEPTPTFPSVESFDPPLSYAPIQNNLPPVANQYQPYSYEQQYNQMPNANFVGSSGFADANPLMSTVPAPMPSRSGLTLMSPYEALSPNSPYMDPILSSPYGSVMSSKKDFQSPYAAILGSDKDYFSMSSISDLF